MGFGLLVIALVGALEALAQGKQALAETGQAEAEKKVSGLTQLKAHLQRRMEEKGGETSEEQLDLGARAATHGQEGDESLKHMQVAEMVSGKRPPTPAPTPKPTPIDYRPTLLAFASQDVDNWEKFETEMRHSISELEQELMTYFASLDTKYQAILAHIDVQQAKWNSKFDYTDTLKQQAEDVLTLNKQDFQRVEGEYEHEHQNMADDLRKVAKSFIPYIRGELKGLRWKVNRLSKDTYDLRTYWHLNTSGFEITTRQKINDHKKLVVALSFDNQEWEKEFYDAQVRSLRRLGKLAIHAMKRADQLEKEMMENFQESFAQFAAGKATRIEYFNNALESMQQEVHTALGSFSNVVDLSFKDHQGRWKEAANEALTEEKSLSKQMESDLDGWHSEFNNDVSKLEREADGVETAMDTAETSVLSADDAIDMKATDFKNGEDAFSRDTDTLREAASNAAAKAEKYITTTYKQTRTKVAGMANRENMKGATTIMKATQKEKEAINKQINDLIEDQTTARDNFRDENKAGAANLAELNVHIETAKTALKNRQETDEQGNAVAKGLEWIADDAQSAVDKKLGELQIALKDSQDQMKTQIDAKESEIKNTLTDRSQFIGASPIYSAASAAVKGLQDRESRYGNEFRAAQTDFDDTVRPVGTKIETQKRKIGDWMTQSYQKVKDSIKSTEGISHVLIPDAYAYASLEAEHLMERVQNIEDTLNGGLGKAVSDANLGYQANKAIYQQERGKAVQAATQELMEEKDEATHDVSAVEERIAATSTLITQKGTELEGEADTAYKKAKEVGISVPVIERDYQQKTLAAAAKAKEVKPDVRGFNREMISETQKMQAKANFLKDHADSFVDTKLRGMLQEIEKRAADVQTLVAKRGGGLTDYASKEAASIAAECGHLKEELRILDAKMRGVAKDTDEWAANLNEEIAGADQAAKHMSMISGKNKLEKQAAIDKRFREINALVGQQVHGLDEGAQKAAQMLMEEAKREAQLVVHSAALSEEDQAARLQKLDGWLSSQIQAVADQSKEVLIGVEKSGELGVDATKDVEERVSALRANMNDMDAVQAVEHNRDEALKTGASFTDLFLDTHQELKAQRDAFMKELGLRSGQHAMEAKQLEVGFEADTDAMLDKLKVQAIQRDRDAADIQSKSGNRSQTIGELTDDAMLFESAMDQEALTIADRMGKHEHARHKRQDAVLGFRDSFTHLSTEVMEETVRLLLDLDHSTDRHVAKDGAKLQKWAQRFSAAEQSDGYKLLKEIHDADKSIDHIDKRDDDILHWKEVYEAETAKWRRAVASSVDDLGGALSAELDSIEAQAKDYEGALSMAMGAERDKALEEALRMMQGEEKDFEGAQAHLADSASGLGRLFGSDAAAGKDAADAAGAAVTAGFDGTANDVKAKQEELSSHLNNAKGANAELDQQVNDFLAQQQAQTDQDRAAAQAGVSAMRSALLGAAPIPHAGAVGTSLVERAAKAGLLHDAVTSGLALADPRARDAMTKALSRNVALSAKHKALIDRLGQLKLPIALAQVNASLSGPFGMPGIPGEMSEAILYSSGASPMGMLNMGRALEKERDDLHAAELDAAGKAKAATPLKIDLDPKYLKNDNGFMHDDKWLKLYAAADKEKILDKHPEMRKRMDSLENSMESAQERYHALSRRHANLVERMKQLQVPYALREAELGTARAQAEHKEQQAELDREWQAAKVDVPQPGPALWDPAPVGS